ncbi:retinol dehydrogenase 12-like [Acanthaster planci]|uniref:Retinol dehydrogenase 12-like n=1 Tax=Acanthaster planci TaxID=133434 RepID=A0A8B7YUV3_ACAPL|nr:retinol dehydrogenase 12-like [Acanthaster planci]
MRIYQYIHDHRGGFASFVWLHIRFAFMMASLSSSLRYLVPVLIAAYAVYYWYVFARLKYFTGDVDLKGKTVIITGGNSGIGKVTAQDLALRGARVILACRNLKKSQDAAEEIKERTGNSEVVVRRLDLGNLQSVREFSSDIVATETRLDILINNAGVADQQVQNVSSTNDNFDFVFGINHFGHFLLTNLLLDLLRKSAPSRVVTVSSIVHTFSPAELNLTRSDPNSAILYPHLESYFISKLANVLFARELARREASSGVVSVSLHPGVVYTPIWKTHMTVKSRLRGFVYYMLSPLMWLLFIDEEAGAQTTLHCALDDSVPDLSGSYFDNCQETKPSALAQDDDLARRLWEVSCEATGLKCSKIKCSYICAQMMSLFKFCSSVRRGTGVKHDAR